MFINRQKELEKLEKLWKSRKANLVVVYGKRRVGKTELIKQFIRKKPAIYFLADKRTEDKQLQELGNRIGKFFDDEILQRTGFTDWVELFRYLKKRVKKPLVLTIDEFPYLAEHNKAISSIFQKGWEEHLKNTPIYLILCGSSISMMEDTVLASKAPLYGRRTGQLLINPFPFYQSWKFFPKYPFEKFLRLFTITGGMPAYLLEFDAEKSLEANIKETVFDKESLLFREVGFVMREELREPRRYLSILHAIAYNKTKFGEISNETNLDSSLLYKYLDRLRDLQIIERHIPVTVEKPEKFRRGTYHLRDNFFKFWFTYIHPYRSELELGNFKEPFRRFKESFLTLVAQNYERVAQEVARKHQNRIFNFERLGRWWDGSNEIDLIGLNKGENKILFGEVKWRNRPIGINVYEKLLETSHKVDWGNKKTQKYFALFSKSGFTEAMRKLAKEEGVLLFEKDRL